MQKFKKDNLTVKIYDTRAEMGANAGKEISDCIKTLLAEKEELNMILADYTTGNILKQEEATFDDFLNRKVAEGKIQEYKDEGEYVVKYKDVYCKLHKKGMTYEVSEIIGNE